MARRREFTKAVKLEIIKRTMDPDHGGPGYAKCEKCRAPVVKFAIDHIDPDAMQTDKSKPLTAAEGQLLCLPCHDEKTKADVADIAKAKRVEAAHLGAKPATPRGFTKVSKEKPPLRVSAGVSEIARRFKAS